MNKNGMYKNYEAHLLLDLTSVMTSEYAKEACEDKEFGWIWEERYGSSRERSQCLRLRGREGPAML